MKTAARGRAATLASLGLSLALAACGSGNDNGGGGSARSVDVALTDEGCDPAKLNRPAGPVTFKVTNKGTDKVTEFEVTDGDRILGEVENVTAGLERSFSLNLTAGSYTIKCPGGSGASQGTLTVSGDRAAGAGGDADLVAAAERYQGYVEDQVGLLRASTRTFVDAVLGGDVAAARRAYAPARVPYGRIEPVAESFGDLDPAIDARAGDAILATQIQSRFEAADESWPRTDRAPGTYRTTNLQTLIHANSLNRSTRWPSPCPRSGASLRGAEADRSLRPRQGAGRQ
jgi:iron uptake system EfeUOB component EfeO/EfeM